MSTWFAVLTASLVAFLLKVIGYLVPPRLLEGPRIAPTLEVLPAALLASLVVLQTFASGTHLVLDARAGGLVVAVIALLLRAPFLLVLVLAAATAAGLRALGMP